MKPQQVNTSHADHPPDVPQAVTHRMLALADSGRVTRMNHPTRPGWLIKFSDRLAPEIATWALSVLTAQDLIEWRPCGEGVELGLPTVAGATQLAGWDAELFGGES